MTNAPPVAGQCDIERLPFERASLFALGNRGFQRFQRGFDFDFNFVRDAAEFRALFFGKLAEILKFDSEESGFAGEIPGTDVL